jgi:hypothetical protein
MGSKYREMEGAALRVFFERDGGKWREAGIKDHATCARTIRPASRF